MRRAGRGRTLWLLPRCGGVGRGQRELDDRAGLAGVDHVDGPAVELDGQLAERQTEAGASATPAGALVEAIEDVGCVLRVDAGPGVTDADDDGSLEGAVACALDGHLPAARGVLHRVRE